MNARVKKSRSPSKGSEGDISDEEEKHYTKAPTPFFVNKKAPRILQTNVEKMKKEIERKARSNSPKQGLVKKVLKTQNRTNQSPLPRKNPPITSHSRALDTSNTEKRVRSPYRTQTKMGQERGYMKVGSEHKLQKNTSPHTGKLLESDEMTALKILARKKRLVNKALWEAAENGDIVKITQLLEP